MGTHHPALPTTSSTLAAPKVDNVLTCSICTDVMTDIDNFITSDTTEQQIVDFAKEVCHLLGTMLGSAEIETQCNAMFEENLPAIIDAFVNGNMNPQEVCTAISLCP